MLTLFNSLSKTLEKIAPISGAINLYSCGPTVYDSAHIGNLRSFIFADLIRRALEFNNLTVNWVMNITDVDDKTIKKTLAEFGESAGPLQLKQLTQRYTETFIKDLKALNIDTDSIHFINVSDAILEIQTFILELINKGFAYTSEDGSTYFNIEHYQTVFGDYGALVGKDFLAGKKTGARVKMDEYEKESLSDFALWKSYDPTTDGAIFWDHPTLGKGRPGWHIECSAINKIAFNGNSTDIHTGGVDLVFPHHTNEIAQSQPLYKPFVHVWCHAEHLLVDGKKMAKREANYYTLQDLIEKDPFAPPAFRYLVLQSHYKSQFNFTFESLLAAKNALKNLDVSWLDQAQYQPQAHPAFTEAINSDLGTPQGLAIFWQVFNDPKLEQSTKASLLHSFNKVLGLNISAFITKDIPAHITNLVRQREQARKEKNFTESDRLRTEIEKRGFTLKDTPDGPIVNQI